MADHVEMTDEELDRLIADFSGDCDVEEGEDFDVVSELDELNNISEFPAFDPKKDVVAKSKGDAIVNVITKPDEINTKGADVIKKDEEKTVAAAKETATEHAEMKKVECVKEMEGEKSLKGAEGKAEPTTEDKKKDKENVKESIIVTAEISVDVVKEKLKKEVKGPVAEERNVTNVKKKPEEKRNSGAAKSTDSPGKSKKILDDQGQKSAGGGQNVKPGDRIKPTKKTLDRTEKKSTDESPSSKGIKHTQSKVDGAKTGKENLKSSAGSSPDAGELVAGKEEEAAMSSPSATSVPRDAGSTSEEKIGDETIGEKENVHGETSTDNSPKSNKGKKKKGSWGWGGISSWGSSVLNQVGGSLYHVLETVESSLVEPESKDSSQSSLSPDKEEALEDTEKSGDGETADEVVLFQPSSAVEIAESKVDKSSRATVKSAAETETRTKDLPPSTGFDDDKIEDLGAEAGAEEALDRKKKSGKKSHARKAKSREEDDQEQSWFSGWDLSAITGAVQQTGKKVVSTGIDVLENISRKTMNILADEPEDGVLPLSPSSSLSSQSLSSRRKKKLDSKTSEDSKAQMLRKCFDDCQGLAHFDALVDLSKTSQEKLTKQLERISRDQLAAVKSDLALIKDASDLGGMDWEESFGNGDHDFCQLIKDFISQLSLSTNVQKLFNVQETMSKWLTSCLQENQHNKKFSAEDIHKMAIMMFADFTATGIAVFHKTAQLLLVDYSTPILSYKFRALSLAGLTKVLCTEIWIEARRFTECLNVPELLTESPDGTLSLITNVTLEASNCSSCLQDGYRLMLPIVQLAALKVHPLMASSSEIANMEILQVMSGMSQNKVSKILNQLSPDARQSVKTQLSTIEAAFDLSDIGHENDGDKSDCDFGPRVSECLQQIGVNVSSQKLLQAQEQTHNWLLSCETDRENSTAMSPSDVNQMALKSLNDLTLCSVDIFHVIGQGLLMENPREISAYGILASAIKELTKVLCLEVGCQSTKFTNCILRISKMREELLGKSPEGRDSSAESVSPFITNIYLEASNSTTHIQDGFQLLLPIIQLALFKAHPACAGFDG